MAREIETKHIRRVCGAYILTHVKSRKVYVGSSGNLGYRFCQHIQFLKKGQHHCSALSSLYEEDPHVEFTYFKASNREEAYAKEQELLNECLETSPEAVLNTARDVMKPQLGIKLSLEHRDKIRQARLGSKATAETRLKMSLFQTGRKNSPEHIEKTRQFHIGRKRSDKTKQAMSDNHTRSRKININGITYSSTLEASRQLSIHQATIWWRANNPRFKDWQFV
jgi:group I intron endonuclease